VSRISKNVLKAIIGDGTDEEVNRQLLYKKYDSCKWGWL